MRVAVIDLGTNTFHLIIADASFSLKKVIFKTSVPVKLGEGRINENIITPEAFERGINALKSFKKVIDSKDVITVKAIATSAIRSATNGADFVKAAELEAGIRIDIITGDEEAAYIYRGVKAVIIMRTTSLIMDIGGGSTEFIICNKDTILWKKSYDIGVARLMQAYFKSDPLSAHDLSSINDRLDAELADLKEACELYQPKRLIGSAGAFETFTAMLYPEKDFKTLKKVTIDLEEYHFMAQTLIYSTHAERKMMPNLIKLRIDTIVIAAIITNYVISNSKVKQLTLSTYDLKMGVLYQLPD